jgi:inorganic pyrophosphatase
MCMNEFFELLKQLLSENEIIIDRPKGSTHPRYPDLLYKVDYGYLKNTKARDGEEIDCWLGSLGDQSLAGIIVMLDEQKQEAEIKVLVSCTEEEIAYILDFHNQNQMKGFLIRHETGNH